MTQDESPPTPRALRGLLVFMVAWAVLLLLAGATVTSTRAGDAVPDWPWSFGAYIWPDRWMEMRNVFYEHGHRLIATVMGLLTIVAAVWIQRVDGRSWVRKLGWIALGAVVFQGVLGGVRVLAVSLPSVRISPTLLKVLHAVTSEVYFCILVGLACVMSEWWRTVVRRPLRDEAMAVIRGAVFGVALLVLQLVLGALARHGVMPREVHAMFALPVTIVLVKLVLATAGDLPSDLGLLRRPGMLIGVLLAAQVALGIWSYLEVSGERDPLVPLSFWDTIPMNLHKIVGAGLLGTTVALLVRTLRVFGLPTDERVQESAGVPVGGAA